jgi:acetyl-CoA carboxylase carboxyltransferase component
MHSPPSPAARACADVMHEMKAKGAKEMIIGYARVSTDGQSVVAQQSALKAARGLAGLCKEDQRRGD